MFTLFVKIYCTSTLIQLFIDKQTKCFFLFLVTFLDSNNELFISGCLGSRLNVWSFPSCKKLKSIKACHPINCVSIEQFPLSPRTKTSGGRVVVAATCSRTGRINTFAPNVALWNVVNGECLKTFYLPSACFVQVCNTNLMDIFFICSFRRRQQPRLIYFGMFWLPSKCMEFSIMRATSIHKSLSFNQLCEH